MADTLAGFIAHAMVFLEPTNQVATAISAAVLSKKHTCSMRLYEELDGAYNALASYTLAQDEEEDRSGAYCILARLSLVNTLCELTMLSGNIQERERDAIRLAWDRAAIMLCAGLEEKEGTAVWKA